MTYRTDMKEIKKLIFDWYKNNKDNITPEHIYQWAKFAYLAGNKLK